MSKILIQLSVINNTVIYKIVIFSVQLNLNASMSIFLGIICHWKSFLWPLFDLGKGSGKERREGEYESLYQLSFWNQCVSNLLEGRFYNYLTKILTNASVEGNRECKLFPLAIVTTSITLSGVFIVNFGHISHHFLVSLLLTLNK